MNANSPAPSTEKAGRRARDTPIEEVVEEMLVRSPRHYPKHSVTTLAPFQFRLRSVFWILAGYSLFFAALRLTGAAAGAVAGGFAVAISVAVFGIALVEASGALRRSAKLRHESRKVRIRELRRLW